VQSHGSNLILKIDGLLKNIPPHVAYKVFADLDLRRKWYKPYEKMEVIEKDPETNATVFYYPIWTPFFMADREALLIKKDRADYPQKGKYVVCSRSYDHPDYPETNRRIRIDVRINGIIISEAPEVNGSRIQWVYSNDIRGTVPTTFVNNTVTKELNKQLELWAKVCLDMMKNGDF
jgi:hypothetical protein